MWVHCLWSSEFCCAWSAGTGEDARIQLPDGRHPSTAIDVMRDVLVQELWVDDLVACQLLHPLTGTGMHGGRGDGPDLRWSPTSKDELRSVIEKNIIHC